MSGNAYTYPQTPPSADVLDRMLRSTQDELRQAKAQIRVLEERNVALQKALSEECHRALEQRVNCEREIGDLQAQLAGVRRALRAWEATI